MDSFWIFCAKSQHHAKWWDTGNVPIEAGNNSSTGTLGATGKEEEMKDINEK